MVELVCGAESWLQNERIAGKGELTKLSECGWISWKVKNMANRSKRVEQVYSERAIPEFKITQVEQLQSDDV